jgi:hypothetical protein
MSATWGLLPRIEVMMFRPDGLVKLGWIWDGFGPPQKEEKVGFVTAGSGGGG